MGRSEDYELFMRLHAAGHRGYNLRDYLLRYREESGSLKRRRADSNYQRFLFMILISRPIHSKEKNTCQTQQARPNGPTRRR